MLKPQKVSSTQVKNMTEETENKQDDFWNNTPAVKAQQKKEEKKFSAMDEDLGDIQLSKEKPVYKEETKVQLVEAKLFKMDEQETDRNNEKFTPFFVTVTYDHDGKSFDETYRGGRIYEKDGKKSFYIGPNSAMGRLKTTCLESNVVIGPSVKTWIAAIKNRDVIVQAQTVMFGGKAYEKNYTIKVLGGDA